MNKNVISISAVRERERERESGNLGEYRGNLNFLHLRRNYPNCRGVHCTSALQRTGSIGVGAISIARSTEKYPSNKTKHYAKIKNDNNILDTHCTPLQNAGITLIALIITIIILLILAGVAIHFTLGENGILKNAELAGNKYKQAEENETNLLNQVYAYMNGEIELQPNTPETKAGTKVKMPDSWYIEKSKKIANVYAVSDGQNNTVPIPKEFYYVGGTLNSGVVISDNAYDKNKYKDALNGDVPSGIKIVEENGIKKLESELKGNQFVWIPCTKEEYHKTSWGQGDTSYSNCYWTQETSLEELNLILKYGGFYVGRYESGLPANIEESTEPIYTGDNIYDIEGIPQSKAGQLPWNFISWNMSQKNAQNMYNKKTVTSDLITGTQWDVIIKKIEEKENKNLTDAKEWGNYKKGENFIYTGRKAQYKSDRNLYPFESVKENGIKENNTYNLLTTGASEHNKAYNLYDIAGNLWEWTQENCTSNNGTIIEEKYVFRGCGLEDDSTAGVCYRFGRQSNTPDLDVGFRVVLYIK